MEFSTRSGLVKERRGGAIPADDIVTPCHVAFLHSPHGMISSCFFIFLFRIYHCCPHDDSATVEGRLSVLVLGRVESERSQAR